MSRKWPADHTNRLIELYEVQPILYNIKSPQYHNKIARQTCLTTIQGSLEAYTKIKYSVEDIVKKIIDNFLKPGLFFKD
ncbi:Alcohol dehydrogenase transcription factor Myb/SANT-like [Popillia japonica]|uniref:Alcohol dehydrogenase transcription factor Myb/SANT-like n=1 Tax=Popillia japonica TaxID=7064 RepID=A0AAW1ITY0_POPJA